MKLYLPSLLLGSLHLNVTSGFGVGQITAGRGITRRINNNYSLNHPSNPSFSRHGGINDSVSVLFGMKDSNENDNVNFNGLASFSNWGPIGDTLRKSITSAILIMSLVGMTPEISITNSNHYVPLPNIHTPRASAANYASLSDEQKAVAEAWRLVDNSFLDRTFNNQDWFQTRQDVIKKKYKNMDEARDGIATMVSTLGDKYTRYLPPDKYQSIVNSATGTLAGIGVEISPTPDGQAIMAADVEENSPAKLGGINPRDIFLEVDGYKFAKDGSALPDNVAERVRGPIGSKVGVVMERDGKTLDFILTRAQIKVTSVKTYLSDRSGVPGKIGVIRIKSFSGTTSSAVADAITDLKKKGATSFLIDVRGNPGGLLPGGVETAGLFLQNNLPVVFVVDKTGVVDSQSTLVTGMALDDPLVIYVNGNTASASEVFTAAMKENNRATVVGSQTFGKGIVQTIRPLSNDNGGVAITVARYETPLHHDINKQGIPVDIELEDCINPDAASCIPASAFKKP